MRSSIPYALATAVILASAGPIPDEHRILRRQNSTSNPDIELLGFLEQTLVDYYGQIAQKFNGNDLQNAGFSNGNQALSLLNDISTTQKEHLAEIQIISPNAVPNCTLDFSAALKDPLTAVNTARMMQYVTAGAYLGGVVTDHALIEVFLEMGINDGQNAQVLNILLEGNPVTQSSALGMTLSEAATAFGAFAPSCNPSLQIQPNTPLTITNPAPITETTVLNFDLSNTACTNQTDNFCQILTGDDNTSSSFPLSGNSGCSLAGIQGPALVYVTSGNVTVPSDILSRASIPGLCAGPALIVVDPASSPSNSTA